MTVSSTTNKATYSGNGTTTVFTVPFYFLEAADLQVILRSGATETVQTLTTQYTVTGAGVPSGGSVTMLTAPPSGTTLTILRNVEATQETDLLPNDRLPAESLETALDKLTMLAQQLDEESGRSLKYPATDAAVSAQLPTSTGRAGKFLSFDASGNPVATIGTDATTATFLQAGAGAVTRSVNDKLRDVVSVKDFGAVGNGSVDDAVAIQAAIDSLGSTGGVVYFPPGEYRIARNVGTNDRWGIKITSSNISLEGNQASLRRFNTDISTYALAYPLIFVGTPDSNAAAQTQNITIKGLRFIGENTRHSASGGALFDFRTAIVFKNTKATNVTQCFFSSIDSSAVWYEPIGAYDYANNTYYNTTKNYQSKISGCSFIAQAHSTPGRALLHCINADGIDGLVIDGNNFEWTDVCLSGESTYDTADQSENDTFTYSTPASRAALGAVKRQSRDIVFSNNTCLNCSEHPLYPAMVSVVISGNTITTDTPNICNTSPIQTRSRGVSISGNVIIGYPSAINISAPSSQVTFSGNTFYATDDFDAAGGAISIDSSGLASYVSNRSDYLTYLPMDDLVITGNIIVGPETYAPTSNEHQNGVRVYTGSVDSTNYPQGKIFNINITGNAFKHWQNGIYFIDNQYRNMVVSGNNFTSKPFTRAGFSGATTVTTRSVIQVYGASNDEAAYATFTNNNVYGSTYLVASRTGAGPATTYYGPEQFSGNKLDYIKNTKTSDIRDFTALTNFRGNTSLAYLDRTFTSSMIFNSLYSGSGSSELKYNMIFDGTNVRFYTDDAGTFITL